MRQHVIFIAVLIAFANAQSEYGYTVDSPADKIKDQPGKCFVEDVGLINKGEEVKVEGQCKKVRCLDDGKYRLTQCPPLAVEPPCYAVYPDKPFPECCTFKIECLKQHTPRPPTPRPRPPTPRPTV